MNNFKPTASITTYSSMISCLGSLCREYNVIKNQLKSELTKADNKNKKESISFKYVQALEQKRILIVIVTCSALEGIINNYLASKLSAEEFKIFEKCSLFEKISILPKTFNNKYTIDNKAISKLNEFIMYRNYLVHTKSEVMENGKIVHPGNVPKQIKLTICNSSIELVLNILKNLIKYLHEEDSLLRYTLENDVAMIESESLS